MALMPTIEIPPIPGICVNQSSLTTYISMFNTSFELLVNTIEEELGISFELPGIPQIPLAGMPSISLPKQDSIELPLRLRRQPGVRGYVGNVYPVGQGGKGVGGKFKLPGFDAFSVDGIGTQFLPGIDPSTHIINWLNTNYEIIGQVLEENGVTVEVTTIPQVDLCAESPQPTDAGGLPGPGAVSPGEILVNGLVNLNNQIIVEAVEGGGDCVSTISSGFSPLNDSGYIILDSGDGSHSVTTTTFHSSWLTTPLIGALSGSELSGWSPVLAPYAPAAPMQLMACSRGVRLEYDWEMICTDDGGDPSQGVQISVRLMSVSPANIETDAITNGYDQIGIGSSSGSDFLELSSAEIPDGNIVAIRVDILSQGNTGAGAGEGTFTYTNLIDLGP